MRGLAGILALTIALAGAEAAQAGTLALTDGGTQYEYSESDGDAGTNNLDASYCSSAVCGSEVFAFSDTTDTMTVNAPGCSHSGAVAAGTYVTCPAAGIASIEALLGGGGDTLTVDVRLAGAIGFTGGRVTVPVLASGGPGGDNLQGGDGPDRLNGDAGADSLNGHAGNDLLDGGLDADALTGGTETDTVTYAGRNESVTVDLAAPDANDGSQADGNPGDRDSISEVERVIGGNAGDDIDGGNLTDPLTLEGGPGGDRLRGGLGANTMLGGSGNDDLEGRGAADLLDGGDGHDTLDGLGGSDEVLGGTGFDTIDARDGVADDVDCGPDADAAATDSVDSRANCDSPPPDPVIQTVTVRETVVTPGRVLADLGYVFAAGRKSTVLRNLALETEPGSRVTASCRFKRKPCKRTRTFTRATASRELRLKAFERRKLPVGAKLTITITKSGMIGAVKTLTIRKRKSPKVTTRCTQPGATRPSAC